MNNNPAWW